ncbi:MAG: hypothetical protein RLZZ15_4032 [Verrucomicrobiota bacterium]|jgi:hypothetical protein
MSPFVRAVALVLLGADFFSPVATRAAADASTRTTAPAGVSESAVTLRWAPSAPENSTARVVEITGLPAAALHALRIADWSDERWAELLAVRVTQAPTPTPTPAPTSTPATAETATSSQGSPADALPAMLGRYRVEGAAVCFEPRYALTAGLRYVATFHAAKLPAPFAAPRATPLMAACEVPLAPAGPPTRVSAIYPSADALPENLLKFYLHFSAPMSGGHIYDRIRLLDDAGRPVELPFLELDEELWDPAMTRLTLLLDPGRIKRGVRPLEEIGSPFVVGRRYTLVLDRAWRDATGQPLAADAEKNFLVTPADRTPPDPARWKINAPAAGTLAPLVVALGKPLDHALALRLIRVTDPAGRATPGEPSLAAHESEWRFTPAVRWTPGLYRLLIATTIEDLAGNNIGKPFDVELTERPDAPATATSVAISFSVR